MARPRHDALTLVVGALATWRLSRLLVAEDGPGGVIVRLRAAVDRTPARGMLDCFGCTSVWVGLGIAALLGRRAAVVTGLALSGAAWFAELVRTDRASAAFDDALPEPEIDSPLVTVV
ncbi:hypothetical protein [Microbacterium sp.]|uniref:hypothetical protein n=1 Tax=Microbacterium sp. TaxID=51671 RepID=UPI003A8547DB